MHLHLSTVPLPRLLALTVCLAGCPPRLGDAPFFCHNGNPECPQGYSCMDMGTQRVCVKDGTEPPHLTDGPPPRETSAEAAPDGQLDPDGQPKPDAPPKPDGQPATTAIAITEFMANPKTVSDTDGEWIELFNPGTQAVDLNGWTLRDKGTDSHVIAATGPLLVPPKGYLIIGRSSDMLLNGGVNVAYAYKDFYLANTADEIELVQTGGKVMESFTYSTATGFTIPDGASLSAKSPGADKNNPVNWCAEPNAWPGSKGDKGSPGANPGC